MNLILNEFEIFDILNGKVSGAINRTLLREFGQAEIPLSTEQWTVLAHLWRKDNVTQQTLCGLTQKDKPSITRLVDKLEKSSFVVRVPNPDDRRKNMIKLTYLGREIEAKVSDVVKSVIKKALKDIDEEELRRGKSLLQRIMKNLNIEE